jgi:hypothetical protein
MRRFAQSSPRLQATYLEILPLLTCFSAAWPLVERDPRETFLELC